MSELLPILEWDTLRCSDCGRYMPEYEVVKHCVDEHPDSVVARAIGMLREREEVSDTSE